MQCLASTNGFESYYLELGKYGEDDLINHLKLAY
jgi:hypothetical protein